MGLRSPMGSATPMGRAAQRSLQAFGLGVRRHVFSLQFEVWGWMFQVWGLASREFAAFGLGWLQEFWWFRVLP